MVLVPLDTSGITVVRYGCICFENLMLFITFIGGGAALYAPPTMHEPLHVLDSLQ